MIIEILIKFDIDLMDTVCVKPTSFRPRVCVRDLSSATHRFLYLKSSANGVYANRRHKEHNDKFDQLAVLTTQYTVNLDSTRTPRLCFSSAKGVVDFLQTEFSGETGHHQRCHQAYLKGKPLSTGGSPHA